MIPAQVSRLIPRLASPFDGEVIATRDAISRLLKAAGGDWHSLAAACLSAPTASEGETSSAATTRPAFGDLARAARDLDRGRLSLKERAFVADMVSRGFGFRPSPKQAAWLDDIFERLRERAAA